MHKISRFAKNLIYFSVNLHIRVFQKKVVLMVFGLENYLKSHFVII